MREHRDDLAIRIHRDLVPTPRKTSTGQRERLLQKCDALVSANAEEKLELVLA